MALKLSISNSIRVQVSFLACACTHFKYHNKNKIYHILITFIVLSHKEFPSSKSRSLFVENSREQRRKLIHVVRYTTGNQRFPSKLFQALILLQCKH